MKEFTFITGNEKKAQYLSALLELPVKRISAELDELQLPILQNLLSIKLSKHIN